MARTKGAKSVKTPTAVVSKATDVGAIPFTKNAQALYDEVSGKWVLDPISEKLLVAACTNLSLAEACHAIVEKEGHHYMSRFDEPKLHPLLSQESTFLVNHANALSKLQPSLE